MFKCLNETTMAAYFSGKLSFFERFKVKNHLATCSNCLEEMLFINQMIKAVENKADQHTFMPHEQVQNVLKSLNNFKNQDYLTWKTKQLSRNRSFIDRAKNMFGWINPGHSLKPVLQPIPILRSIASEESPTPYIHMQKQFEVLCVDIHFVRSENKFVNIHVQVTQESRPAQNIRITCIRQGDGFDSRLLKDRIIFNDCPFDQYTLTITQHAVEKGKVRFHIKEEGVYEC